MEIPAHPEFSVGTVCVAPSPALRLEALEDHAVPAVFGEPWLNGRHLTLSFAPTGTPVSGAGSDLSGIFGAFSSPDAAKVELLRAFQTWAVHANLNLGLVGDNGAAFGTAEAVQNDPRFGDIRVGARALAGDVVAVTTPFSLLTANSGDFILNADKAFGTGNVTGAYDLFTVALQESGHAFGVGNSSDTTSAMYEVYGSARAGLSAGDAASIQGLYGARTTDAYEGLTGNDTLATATPFATALEADLTTGQDVDTYRYVADSSAGRWFRVKAAGLSLVAARLDVLDATGQVIGSAQADSPLQNDVTVYVPTLVPGAAYYLRVSRPGPTRSGSGRTGRRRRHRRRAGRRRPDRPGRHRDGGQHAGDRHHGRPLDRAVRLQAPGPAWRLGRRGLLPHPLPGRRGVPADRVRGRGRARATSCRTWTCTRPWGSSWPARVLAQTDSTVVLSLDTVAANTDYLIRVDTSLGATGNYDVVADFRAALPKMIRGPPGTWTAPTGPRPPP